MQPSEGENTGSKKGLIVAISDYDNLAPLEFCRNDGTQMYHILSRIGCDIPESHNLSGTRLGYLRMHDTIIDFFKDSSIRTEDTLVFYFSGHGVSDEIFNVYLASSETEEFIPSKRGFSFDELTNMMLQCASRRVITILDCCHSGQARTSKGNEEAAVNAASSVITKQAEKLRRGEGRCILSASMGSQKAYQLQEKGLSIFTYYLIEGLKGNAKVAESGNVTVQSLGNYVYNQMMALPAEKRQNQKPVMKIEGGGDIILASYPDLGILYRNTPHTAEIMDEGDLNLQLDNHHKALESFEKVIQINPNYARAHYSKGLYLKALKLYEEAIKSFSVAIQKNPQFDGAYYEIGNILLQLKRIKEAVECYDSALRINPTHEAAVNQKHAAMEINENPHFANRNQRRTSKPAIYVDSVLCSEERNGSVHITFHVLGVIHGTSPLYYVVKLFADNNPQLLHSANHIIEPHFPNPANTTHIFSLSLRKGRYHLRTNINDQELTKVFETPDCSRKA